MDEANGWYHWRLINVVVNISSVSWQIDYVYGSLTSNKLTQGRIPSNLGINCELSLVRAKDNCWKKKEPYVFLFAFLFLSEKFDQKNSLNELGSTWLEKEAALSFLPRTNIVEEKGKIYIYSGWREEGGRMESVDQEGNGRWKIRSRRCILMLLNDLSCKRSFHLCNISRVSNFFFFFFNLPVALLLGCFSFLSLLLASSSLENMPTLCFLLRSLLFFSFFLFEIVNRAASSSSFSLIFRVKAC